MKRLLASFVLSFLVVVAPAAADGEALKDGARKTSDGVGNLFRGMGQEINKLGGSLTNSSKDKKGDGKKADAKAGKKN